jgi:hypothetical protein
LLNSSRKKRDEMIDKLYDYDAEMTIKPQTYKRVMDTTFLNYSKKKNKRKAVHRKRKLLESVDRNLNFAQVMLPNQHILEMGKDFPLSLRDLGFIGGNKSCLSAAKTNV